MGQNPYWKLIRKHLWPVLAGLLIGAILGSVQAARQPQQYASTSQLIINPGVPAKGTSVSDLSTFITNRMESYDALASSAAVVNPVISKLHLHEDASSVLGRVSFSVPTGSTIISTTATASTQESAIELSDAITASLSQAIMDTTPKQSDGTSGVSTVVIQHGQDDVSPKKSSVPVHLLAGAILGGLVGLLVGMAWADRKSVV